MKHATDAMKESRIPDFLASVCALTNVIDLVCFFPIFKNSLPLFGCSLMHCNTEGWTLRSFVLLH